MPSPINIYPRGLLALLGAQTGGVTPKELDASVKSQLEMFQFYALAQSVEIGDATGAITAVLGEYLNLFAGLTVPENEQWYVHRYTCEASLVLPAGETHAVCPIIQTTILTASVPWQLQPHSTFGPGQRPLIMAGAPFWARPGTRFGVYLTNVVGASLTVAYELRALVTRLPV